MEQVSGSTATTTSVDVAAIARDLSGHDGAEMSDAERIDAIRDLEHLKAAACAAQARITARFHTSQTQTAPSSKDRDTVARSATAQVALARQESPSRGQQHTGLALALVHEMPHTLDALSTGVINEWAATLIVRETACLTLEHRTQVDRELHARLAGAGPRKIAGMAREIAYRLDPGAAVRRHRNAVTQRRVTLRPAPDGMAYLTNLLPLAQGVTVYAALRAEAQRLRTQGDPRTINQIMADLLVERITGQAAGGPAQVEIQLVMSQGALFNGTQDPAYLPGFGHLPADLARQIVLEADKTWIRRLFTAPLTGELVAMDSQRRNFRGKLRQLIVLRDQTCRTPWCDAPIRHADHIRSVLRGGKTTGPNAQGLCENCNYVEEAPGWRADVIYLHPHTVEYLTPTGHRYQSHAPPQPGHHPGPDPERDPPKAPGDSATTTRVRQPRFRRREAESTARPAEQQEVRRPLAVDLPLLHAQPGRLQQSDDISHRPQDEAVPGERHLRHPVGVGDAEDAVAGRGEDSPELTERRRQVLDEVDRVQADPAAERAVVEREVLHRGLVKAQPTCGDRVSMTPTSPRQHRIDGSTP